MLKYRADLDGLRAVAVVPVCLFHAGLPLFAGGFVGVDVFFVISGYLMASIIGQSLTNGRFSYADFYERRARRLLPALTVIMLASLLAASFILLPKLFRDFSNTVVATILFISNMLFWRKSSNYFDAGTELNPLLHTWSLAVEEQFYILFPIYLSLLWRVARSARAWLTIGLALLSFGLSLWATARAPTAAFYLAPMRAWELLLGVVVALMHFPTPGEVRDSERRLIRELGGALGLLLVLGSFFLLDANVPFPGYAALAPCLGTALLIHCGREGSSRVSHLLSQRPVVLVGKISYSLYLWHWPLLVFLDKYQVLGSPSLSRRLGIVGVSFVMATLSWRYVEQPFRQGQRIDRRGLVQFVVVSMGLLAAMGGAGAWSEGWPSRFPGLARISVDKQEEDATHVKAGQHDPMNGCFVARRADWGEDKCFLSSGGSSNVLLWGDSFAAHYARGFRQSAGLTANVIQYTAPTCPPVRSFDAASSPHCRAFNDELERLVSQYDIKTVIMAGSWSSYLRSRKLSYAEITATVAFLRSKGLYVVLVGQSPSFTFIYPDEYYYKKYGAAQGTLDYSAEVSVDATINRELERTAKADAFFDPMRVLCQRRECVFKRGTQYLFRDYGHYTAFGSKQMAAELTPYVNRAVAQTALRL